MKYFLAIDIGASSGRHIVGWEEDGEIKTKEVYRFPNGVKEEAEHLVWDIAALFGHVKAGIKAAFRKYPRIESLAVDTWAVDYVLMRGGEEILPCYAYRDARTEDAVGAVHAKVAFSKLYERTGIQFQPFNTVYQLSEDLSRAELGIWCELPVGKKYNYLDYNMRYVETFERCGWKLHRVYAHDWADNAQAEREALAAALAKYVK